jgi:hypothetical protein
MILVLFALLGNGYVLWTAVVVDPWATTTATGVLWTCSMLVVALFLLLGTAGALRWLFFGWTTRISDISFEPKGSPDD